MDPRTNRVHRDGDTVSIEPKVMQVVLLLARHAGRPVTRDRLMEIVWADTIVTDDALTRCVSEARKVFGKDVLETIPRVGYLLAADVEPIQTGREPDDLAGDMPVSVSVARPKDDTQQTPQQTPRHAHHPTYAPVPARWRPVGLVVSAFVVAVTAWIWWASVREADSGPAAQDGRTWTGVGPVVPATALQGREAMAAFSPDGTRLAYVHVPDSGAVSQLHVAQPGGARPFVPYESGHARILSPTWTPDGQDLLFVEVAEDGCTVRTVPALGGAASDVMGCSGRFVSMDLSPDGTRLALDGQETSDAPVRIDIVALATGERTRIPVGNPEHHDYAPRFSPDGTHILFSRSIGEGWLDLYQYELESGTTTRLTQHNAGIVGSDWLGDDGRLVYSMGSMGSFSLMIFNPADGSSRPLGPAGIRPAVDRTNGRLVFETFERDTDLVLQREGAPRPVCESTRHDHAPALLSSGDRIVFVSDRNGPQALYQCDLSSGEVSRIPHPAYDGVAVPSAGPDGRLAFTAVQDGRAHIAVIDAPGQEPRMVTSGAANNVYPQWSPDGNWLYFGSDRTGGMELWRIPPGGGEARQLTREGGLLGIPSADHAWLYFQRPGQVGLWRMAVDDQGARGEPRLVDPAVDLSMLFAWRPYRHGIVLAQSGADGTGSLEFLDPESGARTTLRTLPGISGNQGLAINDDLGIMVMTRTERMDADLKMVEFN